MEFVFSVLRRIETDFDNERFRKLKLGLRVVEDSKSELVSAGFRISDDEKWLIFPSKDKQFLHSEIQRLQQKVDALLDPETITFAQVAEIMKRDGTLPGIRTDIDDSLLGEGFEMSSEAAFSVFRATRPFFGEFIPKSMPMFFGVDRRINPFDTSIHYLARGSPVLLSDRNWRTVSVDAEDFGIDDLHHNKKN